MRRWWRPQVHARDMPTKRESRRELPDGFPWFSHWRVATMATTPRRRKGAVAPSQQSAVRVTLTLDVGLLTRLNAGATLARKSASAYAAELLTEGLRGLILIDKRQSAEADIAAPGN